MDETTKNIKDAITHLSKAVEILNDAVRDNALEIINLKEDIKQIKSVKVLVRNER